MYDVSLGDDPPGVIRIGGSPTEVSGVILEDLPNHGLEKLAFIDQLADHGIACLVPSLEALRNAGDKAHTARCLQAAGVPHPETVVVAPSDLDIAIDELGLPLWIKGRNGSYGTETFLVNTPAEALARATWITARFGEETVVVQRDHEAVDGGGNRRDMRIVVLDGENVGSFKRSQPDRSKPCDMTMGGVASAYEPTVDETAVAIGAVAACGLRYGGVDVTTGPSGPVVIEINMNPDLIINERIGSNIADRLLRASLATA